MMSAPGAHWNVSGSHPLYGRYLQPWLSAQPEGESGGKVLLKFLQTRLGELKDTVRRVL